MIHFFKKHPRSWLVIGMVGLITTLAFFTTFGERGLLHLWRLSEAKRKLDDKNFQLQRSNAMLRERIHRLRHDDRHLEKLAREELGLVREGEIVYRFASSESGM